MGDLEAIKEIKHEYFARCRSLSGALYRVPIEVFRNAIDHSQETCNFLKKSIEYKQAFLERQTDKVIHIKEQEKSSVTFSLYKNIQKIMHKKAFNKSLDALLIKKNTHLSNITKSLHHLLLPPSSKSEQRAASFCSVNRYQLRKPAATLNTHKISVTLPIIWDAKVNKSTYKLFKLF